MNRILSDFLLFVFAASTLLLASCADEEDTEFPKISVSQPSENAIYDYGDTIRFEAVCNDNNKLISIEVMLVDMDNKPMLGNIGIVPGENPFSLKGDYMIDDPMLPGGIYQLRFRASDGTNVTNSFVKIQIHELERQMLYPVIVTHPEENKWKAYRLINGPDWQEIYTHNGDYSGSAVNSSASQLYICGESQSDLAAFRLPDGLALWHVKPGIHQSLRWFEGIIFNYPFLYVSCAEGNIRSYDKTGIEVYKTGTYPNSIPNVSVVTKNFVIGSFKDSFNNEKSLIAFHNEGGLMIRNKFIQPEVVSLLFLENDNVLVFSNMNGQGSILLYNGTDNTLAELHPFFEGAFYEAVALDSDNFLVTGSSGIFWYKYSKNSLSPFATDLMYNQLACDNTSQLVFASSGNLMKVFSFPFATLEESYTMPANAIDLHLVFNK